MSHDFEHEIFFGFLAKVAADPGFIPYDQQCDLIDMFVVHNDLTQNEVVFDMSIPTRLANHIVESYPQLAPYWCLRPDVDELVFVKFYPNLCGSITTRFNMLDTEQKSLVVKTSADEKLLTYFVEDCVKKISFKLLVDLLNNDYFGKEKAASLIFATATKFLTQADQQQFFISLVNYSDLSKEICEAFIKHYGIIAFFDTIFPRASIDCYVDVIDPKDHQLVRDWVKTHNKTSYISDFFALAAHGVISLDDIDLTKWKTVDRYLNEGKHFKFGEMLFDFLVKENKLSPTEILLVLQLAQKPGNGEVISDIVAAVKTTLAN